MLKKFVLLSLLFFSLECLSVEVMVQQILEPTGGKIMKPKNWFYTESQNSSGYVWTLSKEKVSEKGSYDTGVRIQLLAEVKKGTGKTPEQFILSFYEEKKKSVSSVVTTCPVVNQGLFSVICLETIESVPFAGGVKKYHILYSLFWGNNLDVVVVSVAGTFESEWSKYQPIFNKMRAFEIINMSRF